MGRWLWLDGQVKDSGRRSWGLSADQPEDDERDDNSGQREGKTEREGMQRRGIHKGGGKEKGQSAHTVRTEGWAQHRM
jgi:hypothetical protein